MSARAVPAARALAARGHTVLVVMPPWHTPAEAGRRWHDNGVQLEYVSLRGLRAPVAGPLLIAARMARTVAAWRPDVMVAFKPKAYSGLAASWLGAARRGPIIMDTDDWEGAGGWNDIEPYGSLMRWFFARQEIHGLTRSAAVTVASRALESIVWSLGVDRSRVLYVPNAVERVEPLLSRSTGSPPEPSMLLYTRFFEFPVERPLQVLQRVRARVPSARLIVAGKGLFGEEERFLAAAADYGLADAVDYRGWLDPLRADELFGQAMLALYPFDDTLVNRSKSSAKLLELMAAGLPVVAEAVGEISEVIRHGESGMLVPPGDLDAFAAAAADLLDDRGGRERLAAGAQRRIAEHYLWSRRAADLETFYRRQLERHHTA
jgi:glycosyltransferase involved in cell wall biosynthesis